MAYLVIALGALLSVGGGLSVFYGAGIVEVERGWTGVIAGATSLTGGIVTIALGLILKTLMDLRAAGGRGVVFSGEPASSASPLAAAASPQAAEADLEGGLLAAFLAPAEPVAVVTPSSRPEPVELPPTPPVAAEARADVPAEDVVEPAPAKPRFRISFKSPQAEPPPHEPEPVAEPPVPAMDDWLDRAFSSLDTELAGHGEPARAPEPAQSEAHAGAAPESFAGHGVAELDPPRPLETDRFEVAPAPAPQPAPPQPAAAQSAVIGRYEADGTSYVMFADGSIEAQSEAGVYRFGSMTELKAFIEGTG